MTQDILEQDVLAATDAREIIFPDSVKKTMNRRGISEDEVRKAINAPEEASYEGGGPPTKPISQSLLKRELSSLAPFGPVVTGSSEHSAKSDMNGTRVTRLLPNPNRVYLSDSWGTGKVLAIEVPNDTWTVPCFSFYDADLVDYLQRDRLAMGSPLPGSSQRRRHSYWTRLEFEYRQFRRQLIGSLSEEPIEDGISHPAERLIQQSLLRDAAGCRDWLSRILVTLYPVRPSLSASLLRCVGRLEYSHVKGWGLRVVDDALHNVDAEVRDAAICALEKWGGDESLRILRRHCDSEDWLNDYVRQVIIDLSNEAL